MWDGSGKLIVADKLTAAAADQLRGKKEVCSVPRGSIIQHCSPFVPLSPGPARFCFHVNSGQRTRAICSMSATAHQPENCRKKHNA